MSPVRRLNGVLPLQQSRSRVVLEQFGITDVAARRINGLVGWGAAKPTNPKTAPFGCAEAHRGTEEPRLGSRLLSRPMRQRRFVTKNWIYPSKR
jgi:hypothetical protein